MMLRVAALCSGGGTSLGELYKRIAEKKLAIEIVGVLSNKPECIALKVARDRGFHTWSASSKELGRSAFESELLAELARLKPDYIYMAGYMLILGAEFINRWFGKIYNVHPSLLPQYAGMMDMAIHRAVLADGKVQTGCSIHHVTQDLDMGSVVIQKVVKTAGVNSADELKKLVQAQEAIAWTELSEQLIKERKKCRK